VSIRNWRTSDAEDILEAECAYRGFRHSRYVHFLKPCALLVVDSVNGAPGEHLLEQFWHVASEDWIKLFRFPVPVEQTIGWRSRCFGQREPGPVLVARRHSELPAILPAAIRLTESADIDIVLENGTVRFRVTITSKNQEIIVNYPSGLR
jgi:hypothetical protein